MLSCRINGVLRRIGATKTRFIVGASLLLCASVPLFSQGNLGRILGTVTDQTGAPVPGVTVTIIDVDRGVERSVTTDSSGEYNAPSLVPGNKRVRAQISGFKVSEQTGIKLEVGQDIRT